MTSRRIRSPKPFAVNYFVWIRCTVSSVADPDSNPDPWDPFVLGLLDPDPLVRGMDPDPDPDPAIIKQI